MLGKHTSGLQHEEGVGCVMCANVSFLYCVRTLHSVFLLLSMCCIMLGVKIINKNSVVQLHRVYNSVNDSRSKFAECSRTEWGKKMGRVSDPSSHFSPFTKLNLSFAFKNKFPPFFRNEFLDFSG